MLRKDRERADMRAKGIRAVSFEPLDLPCPGHDDNRCQQALCSVCKHFSTAPALGAVRQAPAHAIDQCGNAWFCVDFEAGAHGAANLHPTECAAQSADFGGVCASSSAPVGLGA